MQTYDSFICGHGKYPHNTAGSSAIGLSSVTTLIIATRTTGWRGRGLLVGMGTMTQHTHISKMTNNVELIGILISLNETIISQ